MHGIWASRWTFILAAVGSAVGLGNIWKFPYITGEYGGGAFVLVYLVCVLAVGIPVMMAEILLGRKARMSPVHTMERLTTQYKAPKIFSGIGWMGATAGFFILSFYSDRRSVFSRPRWMPRAITTPTNNINRVCNTVRRR